MNEQFNPDRLHDELTTARAFAWTFIDAVTHELDFPTTSDYRLRAARQLKAALEQIEEVEG
jgi:hypothetical protein